MVSSLIVKFVSVSLNIEGCLGEWKGLEKIPRGRD